MTSTIDDPAGLAAMRADARALGIADHVDYLGFVPYEDLPPLLLSRRRAAPDRDVGELGRHVDVAPVKEALACGTAVIRSGATEEDVEDGVSGYLVDPSDSPAAGARLAELLRDPARAAAFGEAGRVRITALYRWDRVVDLVDRAIG